MSYRLTDVTDLPRSSHSSRASVHRQSAVDFVSRIQVLIRGSLARNHRL